MSADFGDADPEDAYDASDPIDERLRIIGLAILSARADPERRKVRLAALRMLLLKIVGELDG